MKMPLESNACVMPVEDNNNHQKSANVYNESDNKSNNFLLCLFVQYVWDQKEDNQNLDYAAKKLIDWLESVNIDLKDEFWYFSAKLDVRTRSKIDLTDSIKSNESLLRETKNSNDKIVCAQLAYSLRKFLPLLHYGKDDVNYKNEKSQTLLHIFLEECNKVVDNFRKDQILRAQKVIKNLLKRGASLYVIDQARKMPFDIAAQCQNKDLTRFIIYCLDINAIDQNGDTALHLIFRGCVDEADYIDIVRILVFRGIDVNVKNYKGVTPVHLAAEKLHIEVLEFFADRRAKFDQQTKNKETPLHFVCKSSVKIKDQSKLIKSFDFLISQGCDVEAMDEKGYMPLHYAAESGTVEIIDKLIELGVCIDCRTKPLLITPLHLASKSDRLNNIKRLVDAGADVNAKAVDGTTPLHMIVLWGSLESMQYLIGQGADVHQREKYRGFTLLHLAALDNNSKTESERSSATAEHVEKRTKFQVLIDKDFDINDPAYCGLMPLHLALISRNTEFVRILVERGANANLQDVTLNWTAIHIASMKKDLETLKILLKSGADVNCRAGVNRATPLHLALMLNVSLGLGRDFEDTIDRELSLMVKFWPADLPVKGQPYAYKNAAMLLIESGAEVNARDASGKTPLHWATLQPYTDVVKKLLESGAQVNVTDVSGQSPLHNVLKTDNAQAFKLLLECGADINDDDISEHIVESNESVKNLATQHAIKFKLVGLPIAKSYQSLVSNPAFENYHEMCSNEAKALINHRDDKFSLYNFLHMDGKRQYYVTEKITNCYGNLEELFPLYSSVIRGACREAINRKPILEDAKIAWYQMCNVYLPDICVDHILSHLSNRYLEVLSKSTQNYENVTVVEERKSALRSSVSVNF